MSNQTPTGSHVERVAVSAEAADMLRLLLGRHGALMFHQSGGCCDGSSPMCYPKGDFLLGDADIKLEDLRVDGVDEPIEFWMSLAQYEYWKHTHLTVDQVLGRGSGFSLEAPEGYHFLTRSRMLTEEELRGLGLC